MQIEGPPVEIADPDRNSLVITIPPGTDRLGFLLVAAHRDSVRGRAGARPGAIPQESRRGGSPVRGKVRASAGTIYRAGGAPSDTQWLASRPNDAKSLRWLGRPRRCLPQQLGSFLSFVPTRASGLYKFLLIAAGSDGEGLAEPDEVAVLVGAPPTSPRPDPRPPDAIQPAAAVRHPTPDQILGAAAPRLPNSARSARTSRT
ncbi:MAG: hypothetical protein U0790_18850 [Isosphaeraceae bacterium]